MKSAKRFLLSLLVGIALCEPCGSLAQDEIAAPKIRRVYVPKDDPGSWPAGNWTPFFPEKLGDRSAVPPKSDPRESAGWFRKSTYSATFHEGVLTDGRLELELEPARLSSGSAAQYAPWDDVNLALSQLFWENQIAELGSNSSGRTLLVIPARATQLRGEWSFAGRKLSSGHHFQLKLPPSAVGSLELFVPSNRELILPQKQPVQESFDSETNTRRYQISLGSAREAEFLIISRQSRQSTASSRGLYSHAEASFVLSRHEFRFQQELLLESLGAPRSEISIPIPEGFEIRSVEWGGAAIETWFVTNSDPRSLNILLPSPLQGSSRPLRILGIASFSLDRELDLPRLIPREAVSLSEEVSLSVSPPLELKAIDRVGYRQVSASTGPDGANVVEFQRMFPNPSLRFRVGPPESRIQASLLTHLDRRRGRFLAESHAVFRMSTGSTYQLAMSIAPGWELVQIELLSGSAPAPSSRVAWQLIESSQGRRRIEIDLPRALSRGNPVELRLTARSATSEPVELPLPLLQLDNSIRAEQRLLVAREILSSSEFDSLEAWSRSNSNELPAEFANTRSRKALDLQPEQFLLYYSDSSTESRLVIPEPKPEFEVYVTNRVQEQIDRVVEEAQIGIIIPEGSQPVSDLILTCVGETQDLRWELIDRPEIELQVQSEAVRMSDGRTRIMLRFEPSIQHSSTIVVRREMDFQSVKANEFKALLPFAPEAEPFAGTILFQSEIAGSAPADKRLETLGLKTKPILPPERDPEFWSADYADETARLNVLSIDSHAERLPVEAYLSLESILMGAGSDGFLHRLEVHLPPGLQQLSFQFPDVEYSVLANGVPVAALTDQEGMSANLYWKDSRSSPSVILFEYSSDAGRRGDSLNSSIPIPEIAAGKTYFRWTVSLPPGVHLAEYPPRIRPHTPLFEPLMTRRLFGPVGRNHQARFFDPRRSEKWTGILNRRSEAGGEIETMLSADWSRYRFSSDQAPVVLSATFWSEPHQIPMAWGVLIVTVLAICLLRINQFPARSRIASWWLLLVVATALLVPSRYVIYSGALLIGSLVSILIPQSLLLGRKYFELSSTQIEQTAEGSTISKSVVASVLVFCLSLGGINSAQEPQAAPTPDEVIEILVPYKDANDPAQSAPEIVYVRERDRPRLERSAKIERESVLITAIDYHCRIPVSGLVELQAVCQIHIPADVSAKEVVVPIQGANLAAENACLVDGHPAPVSLTQDGFPRIDLSSSRGEEHGNRTESSLRASRPGEPAQEPRTRIVILNLYPPIDANPNGTGFTLSVPRVPVGSIWCEFPPEASSRIHLHGARGEVSFERPGILTAVLGNIDRWEIRIRSEIEFAPLPRVETQTQLFLTAQPAYMRYRYRISHRVFEGSLNFLAWELPPEFDLLRIRGAGILRHSIREDSGRRKLLFDLENPLTSDSEPLVIEGEFLSSARSSREDETEVGIPDLFPSISSPIGLFDDAIEYRSAGLLVGLSSPPELPLTIVEQQTDRLRAVDPNLFLPQWPEDARLQTPEFCFEAKAPAELKFLFTSIRPSREVSVTEQGVISDRTFDWTWTGEIQTSDSPVFEHRFRVDPRLEILSVSVREDRAEREHQWFRETGQLREADQLTVRLGRKTEALQTLTLRGQMPLDVRGELTFPYFRLLEAEYLSSEFDVYRTGRWIVRSEQGASLAAEESGKQYDEQERILIGRYTDREDKPIPPVALTRKSPPAFGQTAVTLRKRADADFDVTAEMQLSNLSADTLTIDVPVEWVARLKFDSEEEHGDDPEIQLLPDGSARVTLAVAANSASLTLKTTLSPPAEGTSWELSRPRFEGNVETTRRLLVRAADGWLPSADCLLVEENRKDARSNGSALLPGYEAYATNCDPLVLIRAGRADSRAVPKFPILISYLEAFDGGPPSGRWFLLYEGRGASGMTLKVPSELTEFDCRLNGGAVPAEYDSKERLLTIPFPSGLTSASIEIHWRSSGIPGTNLVQKILVESPVSTEIPVEHRELVLLTDSDRKIAMFDGMSIHPARETRRALLERIAELLEGAVDAEEAVPPFLPLLLRSLRESLAGEAPEVLSQALRERLAKLDSAIPPAIESLPETLALGRFSLDYPELIAGSELPGLTVIHASLPEDGGDGGDAISQTWLVSRKWLTIAGTILAGLIALPLLQFLFRAKTGEWLARHRAVSYLGLGLLWWLCLDFSLVGLVMATIALMSILWSLLRGPSIVVVRRT